MLDHAAILALIPHQGAMCLLDRVGAWSAQAILCHATSHLDPANPLRRRGQLGTICGLEYALQAAALHGALRGDAPQPPGRLVALRDISIYRPRLDDPAIGTLAVEARMEHGNAAGLIYWFRLLTEAGESVAEGRSTIALPRDLEPGIMRTGVLEANATHAARHET